MSTTTDLLAINTIRTLSMDAVQQAGSGHPGTPMALAPVAYHLWNRVLRFDVDQPGWPARDRFVLSCGHASMLLYSLLHLADVKQVDAAGRGTSTPAVSLDDIRRFRQLGSPCAGHPEHGDASGIETTTGPLGQGAGNSVGMAMAARWLSARYDRPDFALFGFNVYALCSDGDLMEGVGCEAASLAGHLRLPNLCWIYDDNRITIEGRTDLSFSEDVAERFRGLGWHPVCVSDANDLAAIHAAFEEFQSVDDRPTIILLRSIIGYGAPHKADTHGAHGTPLGAEEVRLTKQAYGWPPDAQFHVPEEARDAFSGGIGRRGRELGKAWRGGMKEYAAHYPREAVELAAIWERRSPDAWRDQIPSFPEDAKGLASRAASGRVLNAVAPHFPWLLGGSADLAPSNNTLLADEQCGHFGPADHGGRNLHFGVREHAMAAVSNGLSLTGLRAYAGTFLVFSDYLRPSLRLSAIMHQPVLYVLTHDSIGLGEDGPTHQPVEHLAACRAIPGLHVVRPGDANEVAAAYRRILSTSDRPALLVLTRQNLPTLCRDRYAGADGVARGGYVLADPPESDPGLILIGTGSELSICVEVYEKLTAEGVAVRVVSLPCWEWFDEQPADYRDSVLPSAVSRRVAVEAGVQQGWEKYLGTRGVFVGMSSFGASAPFEELYRHFGITAERVETVARQLMK